MNRKIFSALDKARIPVVLLDRRPGGAPEQHRPDLVGINNRQAGYVATGHLIRLGCRRIGFLAHHGSATTIRERFAGYRDALAAHGLSVEKGMPAYLPEEDAVDEASATKEAEAFVCVNDRIAARLMRAYLARGIRVPEDIRIVGIDDVNYAALLPVPLTTVRQPCRAIGEAALAAMLDRIDRPRAPARDILLDGELVIRKSCGGLLAPSMD